MIRVGVSSRLGTRARGVFAQRHIEAGETIELAPVIVLTRDHSKAVRATMLDDYAFEWGGGCLALALGCGSLYNHSFSPNAHYYQDTPNRRMEFVAIETIRPGEEITINYNGDPDCDKPLWFGVEEV